MLTDIIMPKLGETMEEGKLIAWRKKEGDLVKKDEILFEVSTDKANFEVEAIKDGVLRKILVSAGDDNVPVTKVVAYLADKMDDPLPGEGTNTNQPNVVEEVKPYNKGISIEPVNTDFVAKDHSIPEQINTSQRIRISPLARKIAMDNGIDINQIRNLGTGPEGRIVKQDVLTFLSCKPQITGPVATGEMDKTKFNVKEIPFTAMRKIIAERLTQSKQQIPHYYLQVQIDMTELVRLRTAQVDLAEKKYKVRVSLMDYLFKAMANTIPEYALLNAKVENNKILVYNEINIGFAVSLPDGLVVPVIRNVETKSIVTIAQDRINLTAQARAQKVTLPEMAQGTITVSNLGTYGIDSFTAVINPPQVAILAIGQVKEGLLVQEGKIMIRNLMNLTLSADHRVIDGAYGAEYLRKLKLVLEKPEFQV